MTSDDADSGGGASTTDKRFDDALADPERRAVVDVLARHGGAIGLQHLARAVAGHDATAATDSRAHHRAVWLRLTGEGGHIERLADAGVVEADGAETVAPGPAFDGVADGGADGETREPNEPTTTIQAPGPWWTMATIVGAYGGLLAGVGGLFAVLTAVAGSDPVGLRLVAAGTVLALAGAAGRRWWS